MNAAHRRGWLLALLTAGALTVAAGCTTTVEGSGTFAQGGGDSDGGGAGGGGFGGGGGGGEETSPPPSDLPSPGGGGGDDGGDGGGGDGGGSGGGGGGQGGGGDVSRDADAQASPVCQLFTDEQLLDLFGGPVDLTVPSLDTSCEFTARGTTDYVDLTVRPDDDAHYAMLDDATPITIAGHPGLEDFVTTSISLGSDIDEPGCLQGDNWFSFERDDQGRQIARTMVEAAIGEFETG